MAFSVAYQHEYKGYKICLGETKPGIWIAVTLRLDGSPITYLGRSTERWVGMAFNAKEYALADAKAVIDSGAFG